MPIRLAKTEMQDCTKGCASENRLYAEVFDGVPFHQLSSGGQRLLYMHALTLPEGEKDIQATVFLLAYYPAFTKHLST